MTERETGAASTAPERVLLGEGMLTWFRDERVTDRYGAIYLRDAYPDDMTAHEKYVGPEPPGLRPWIPLATDGLLGRRGRLEAEVTESRQSDHIGDLFRGIAPPRPPKRVGYRAVLGVGRLFDHRAEAEGITVTGLEPEDGRSSDWLDPRSLYDLHEQTVRLYFVPDASEAKPTSPGAAGEPQHVAMIGWVETRGEER